jgi:hypothetical protein
MAHFVDGLRRQVFALTAIIGVEVGLDARDDPWVRFAAADLVADTVAAG